MLRYFAISQGAAGTLEIAAAVAGKRHKVLGFLFSLNNDGTIRFVGGANLSGNIKVDGQLQPVGYGPHQIPCMQTDLGAALQIVTTQAAQGFVVFVTEP